MSMDARIMATLPSHPKTRKLIKRHGQAAAWNLVCLFLFACANKSDGILSGMAAEDIELACDWQGEDGAFIQALVEVGFLDHDGQTYSIHDWATHNPWVASANKRTQIARANALKKWGGPESSAQATRAKRLMDAREKGTHTSHEWATLKDICGQLCLRCESRTDLVKDHITPIYQGGSDSIENIQPLCRSCNSSKGPEAIDYRPKDWMERLRNACKTPADNYKTPAPSPTPSPLPNPSPNQLQPQKGGRDALVLPDCIPADAWEMWDRYRKSKKGWTADAKKLNLRTLTEIANKGHDPRKVVETSIERGWTGLFEPKIDPSAAEPKDYRRPLL